jgi:hypothetical protein
VQIARQQQERNQSQLRLNLFNKRFEVFEAAMQLIALVSRNGTVTDKGRIDFVQKTKAARFLFGKEAEDYFTHLNSEAIAIQVGSQLSDILGEGVKSEQSQFPMLLGARRMWFNGQLDELPKEFDDFLTVETLPNSSKKRFTARFNPEQPEIPL